MISQQCTTQHEEGGAIHSDGAEQIIIIFLCSDKCQTNYKFGLTLERVDRSYMQHNKEVI